MNKKTVSLLLGLRVDHVVLGCSSGLSTYTTYSILDFFFNVSYINFINLISGIDILFLESP